MLFCSHSQLLTFVIFNGQTWVGKQTCRKLTFQLTEMRWMKFCEETFVVCLYVLYVCVRELHSFIGYCVCVKFTIGCLYMQQSVCYCAVLCNLVVSLYIFTCTVHVLVHVWLQTLLTHNDKCTLVVQSGLGTELSYKHSTHRYARDFVPTLKTVLINLASNGSHENSSWQDQIITYITMIRLHAEFSWLWTFCNTMLHGVFTLHIYISPPDTKSMSAVLECCEKNVMAAGQN